MKRLALLAMGLTVALCSCKESEEKTLPAAELIQGTWKLDMIHVEEFENGKKVGSEIAYEQWNMTFSETHYSIVDYRSFETTSGPYSLTADSLFLLDGGEFIAFKLKELSEKQLSFTQYDEYAFDSLSYRDELTYMFGR